MILRGWSLSRKPCWVRGIDQAVDDWFRCDRLLEMRRHLRADDRTRPGSAGRGRHGQGGTGRRRPLRQQSPVRGSQAAAYSLMRPPMRSQRRMAVIVGGRDGGGGGATLRRSKLKTAMRTIPVVVGHVVGQDALEMPATDK